MSRQVPFIYYGDSVASQNIAPATSSALANLPEYTIFLIAFFLVHPANEYLC